MVKDLYLLGICCLLLGLAQGASEKQQRRFGSISDQLKRDGNPNPNDLFWANRGKKSSLEALEPQPAGSADLLFWPKPHSLLSPVMIKSRLRRNFASMRPNSFMNMYMNGASAEEGPMPKRNTQQTRQIRNMMKSLRPNNFLFPSMSQTGKRNGPSLWNVARPNSHLFPQMSSRGRKRSGSDDGPNTSFQRPNSFIFPIPKRDDFFAGRGKRGDEEEDDDDVMDMEKRSEMEEAAFFAGRGKKAAAEMAEANFFAGRGKKSDEDVASFFAGRGKKADDDVASFFAGRGKRGEDGVEDEMTFFAGRGKREAKAKKESSSEEDKGIFWAVRG